MASHKLIWLLLLTNIQGPQSVSAQAPVNKGDETPAQVAPLPPSGTGETKEPPRQGARPQTAASPEPPPPAQAQESACNPAGGEICLTAAKQENLGDGHHHATGFVDLRFGDAQLQADELDLYLTPRPDGTSSRRIKAQGNVVFLRGEERLAGDRLEMDLDGGAGVFDNAMGYAQPGIFVEARKIERLSADTYRIHGGRFTSCSQPNPRWRFGAQSATLKMDDKVKAKHVVFRVLGVPAFYLPYFVYPIQKDQRSTGFLMPHYVSDPLKGHNLGSGFFWAMGRSLDQTFALDYYSKWGWGFGHDFRYVRGGPSRGGFRSFFNRRQSEGGGMIWEHHLNWNARQMLPGRLRAEVLVQDSSTQQFRQQFQDDPDAMYNRSRIRSLSLRRDFSPATLTLLAKSDATFGGGQERVRQQFPSLLVSGNSRTHRGTGLVLQYSAAAERLARFSSDDEGHAPYSRYSLTPQLSRTLRTAFLSVRPSVQFHYTHYGRSDDPEAEGADLLGPPLDWRRLEGKVEVEGPRFSRIFVTPGNFYSERFQHVIGPRFTWTYRSPVDNFEAAPSFDGTDRSPGTTEFQYGLEQSVSAKRRAPSGKLESWRLLTWRVGQTYYLNPESRAFDPWYRSSTYARGGEPSHHSPVSTDLAVKPSVGLNTKLYLEYDTDLKRVRNLSLSLWASSELAGLSATWSRHTDPQHGPVGATPYDTLFGNARLSLIPKHLTVSGVAHYRFDRKQLANFAARGRYDIQCCALIVDVARKDIGDGRFRWTEAFSIELANIGSTGNFLGAQPMSGASRGFP